MRAILTYHSVDTTDSVISIRPEVFRRHIERLARHGPRLVTVPELLRLPAREPAVAITFDDAFVNFADAAWPVLRDHGVPVTLFVPTDHVGGTNAWSADDPAIPDLPILDWDALGRLAAQGVTLGSHTCTHARLTQLGPDRMGEELRRSARQIEAMVGVPAAGLAYPYGACDARVARAAADVYAHACTTQLRLLGKSDDPHRLPRLDAYYLRGERTMDAWGSARLRVYLRARAGARRCRELLQAGAG